MAQGKRMTLENMSHANARLSKSPHTVQTTATRCIRHTCLESPLKAIARAIVEPGLETCLVTDITCRQPHISPHMPSITHEVTSAVSTLVEGFSLVPKSKERRFGFWTDGWLDMCLPFCLAVCVVSHVCVWCVCRHCLCMYACMYAFCVLADGWTDERMDRRMDASCVPQIALKY